MPPLRPPRKGTPRAQRTPRLRHKPAGAKGSGPLVHASSGGGAGGGAGGGSGGGGLFGSAAPAENGHPGGGGHQARPRLVDWERSVMLIAGCVAANSALAGGAPTMSTGAPVAVCEGIVQAAG